MPEPVSSARQTSERAARLLLAQLFIAAVTSGAFVAFLGTQIVPHWQQQHAVTLTTEGSQTGTLTMLGMFSRLESFQRYCRVRSATDWGW